jgi:hypothetical protein
MMSTPCALSRLTGKDPKTLDRMKLYGRSTLSEFVGDRVVYRNLQPCDKRLPGLDELRAALNLPPGIIPRKTEPEYAQVIALLLSKAHELETKKGWIKRLVFVGDTRLLDGTAFENICAAGGWPGKAFIGSENDSAGEEEIIPTESGQILYLSNRWSALEAFSTYCQADGFPFDEKTAVVIDIDKTAIGARGRNSHMIDQARVQAVETTVSGLLGGDFDPASFKEAYTLLNGVEFHTFTTDNQDYLAYLCLVLGSGLITLSDLADRIRSGNLKSFPKFINEVNTQRAKLPQGLAAIHDKVYANVESGDPTPFKDFRRNEYLETVGKMGQLSSDLPVETMLANEILITREVQAEALRWSQSGALLFSLSDKPDEASLPTPELAARGYMPIHHTETHVVGEEVG